MSFNGRFNALMYDRNEASLKLLNFRDWPSGEIRSRLQLGRPQKFLERHSFELGICRVQCVSAGSPYACHTVPGVSSYGSEVRVDLSNMP